MGFVQTLGSAVKSASATTVVLPITVTTAVGNRVVVSASVVASATGQTLTLTDSKGNTWAPHGLDNSLAAFTTGQWSTVIPDAGHQLASGDTITVTQSGTGTANGFIEALEFSGTTTPITSSSAHSSTNVSTVTGISVTEAAAAFYVGILHTNNGTTPASTGSLSSPWVAEESGQTGTSNLHWYQVWYQPQGAGATVGFAPTLSAAAAYGGMLTGFTNSVVPAAAGGISLTGTSGPPVVAALGALTLNGTAAAGTVTVFHSWVGAPNPSGFRIRSKTSGATSVRLAVSTSAGMTSPTYFGPQTPDGNGYTDFVVTGLSPGTQYFYQLTDNPGGGEAFVGTVGKAKTLPALGAANFKFGFGGCTNGYNVNREAVDDIRAWGADFFLHLGDFHYKSLVSTTASVHRQGWEDQINFAPGLRELVRDVPFWYCRSDHEAGPDNGDSNNTYTAASIAGYQQIVPYGTLGDVQAPPHGLYQSWVVGRVRFILIDIRNIDRSPGGNTDDSSKTMLGATQKTWLKARLLDPEPVKVIVSDVAWMGPADIVAKPDAWWSYATERTEIANYIAANNVAVLFIHSDTHSIACASPAKNIYGGFPVYCAAPLANQGGGRDLSTFDASYSTTPTTTDSRQYGRVTVTDTGTAITFVFSGWDAVTASQQVGRTDVFQTPVAGGSLALTGNPAAAAGAASSGSIALAGGSGASASPVAAGGLTLSGTSTATPGSLPGSALGSIVLSGTANPTITPLGTGVQKNLRLRWAVDVGSIHKDLRLQWSVAEVDQPFLNLGFIQDMDEAMLDKVTGLRVYDRISGPKGPGTSGRPVRAWFRRPEGDSQKITYPYVLVELLDYRPAYDRMQQGYVESLHYTPRGYQAPAAGSFLTTDQMPIPYDFTWQITVVSLFIEHDRQLDMLMLADDRLPPRGAYLVVNDTVRYMTVVKSPSADYNRPVGNNTTQRVFRKIYTVTATAELFQRDLITYGPPTTLDIDVVVKPSA